MLAVSSSTAGVRYIGLIVMTNALGEWSEALCAPLLPDLPLCRRSLKTLVALSPVPPVCSKSPRTLEDILISCGEVKDISNSNEKIHRYLTVFPEYDSLEKKRIIPNPLC